MPLIFIMVKIGYTLSSEEHSPGDLVNQATKAEEAGFDFLSISDHFHPWLDVQGNSPFVWAVLGAISKVTKKVEVMTGVTCPTVRTHPAIIAQAAATTALLFEGGFSLGIGSGENLNEHIVGLGWPETAVRQEMMVEAVKIIRDLWTGEWVSYYGDYFVVEKAKIYSRPQNPPPILIAGMGQRSAKIAGQIGDGFVSTRPQNEIVQAFQEAGGKGKPKYAQVSVCFHEDENKSKEVAAKYWPITVFPGQSHQELRLPSQFEELARNAKPEEVAEHITCGNDVKKHLNAINKYIDAGYDHVYVHNVGPVNPDFFTFYEEKILPKFKS